MINLQLGDSLEAMRLMPDKAYDLAIVDPDYGLGDRLLKGGRNGHFKMGQSYEDSGWEDVAPPEEYFSELFRISKNQIIWGGNHFRLPPCRGFIVWDKDRTITNVSQAEYAWTSFDIPARIFKFCNNGGFVLKDEDKKIHPTQKPCSLYRWILKNYAKPGDRIFDSHGGSMSIAIACYDLGFSLDLWEKDPRHFADGNKRFDIHKRQLQLFRPNALAYP